MTFLTQGNTNWKFLLIVIVLAIIFGAGVWSYLQMAEEEFKIPPLDIPERVIEDETASWQTYRNEEYGFEIKHPFDSEYSGEGQIKKGSWPLLTFLIFTPMENSLDDYLNLYVDKSVNNIIEKSGKSFGDAKNGIFYTANIGFDYVEMGFIFNNSPFTYHFRTDNSYFKADIDLFPESLATIKFIDRSPKISTREIEEFRVYKNESYGIEFEYPKDLGSLALRSVKKDIMDNEIYVFSVSGELISTLYYHQPTKTVAFIKKGGKYDAFAGYQARQDILQVYKEKTIKTIYSAPLDRTIGNISISPNGKYVFFSIFGWEYSDSVIVNIDSGLNIIDRYPMYFGDGYELTHQAYWSPNNKVLAIRSFSGIMGLSPIDGLVVSDYDNPEKLNEILSFVWQETNTYIYDIHFIGDDELFFTVLAKECSHEGELVACSPDGKTVYKYKYNTITRDLEKIKGENILFETEGVSPKILSGPEELEEK